ncbi:AzlD domain-containing protein [Knoellia subterranea]|uniref:Branched-chain amino acid transporter AzlD n=1 Tax=Knoellia subterranea KCTC 19937 TaxID=1385521 RepID=A0A0A0JNY6_9MICO|nr:AzlD domain-containing protein [Knoellia subterranea]KGN39120.1 branched-chain amino acid transporter AzlD [Knoellia subterranea KCTC 19937]
MSSWTLVLLASALAFATKFAGYLVPESWVDGPRRSRVLTLLPVALLSGLVAIQTFGGDGGSLHLDARLAAVAAAIVLLLLRANFLVVVIGAAAVAALLRSLGWG